MIDIIAKLTFYLIIFNIFKLLYIFVPAIALIMYKFTVHNFINILKATTRI